MTVKENNTQFSAPSREAATETEKKLAQIWRDVLGISEIGVHDSFFDLGGTSIKAVSLFGAIEKQFDKALPLTTLFESSTIEQLAKVLQPKVLQPSPEEVTKSLSSMVLLKSGKAKTPLFMIHDVDGEAILYLNLAQRLHTDRPVYGLIPYAKEHFPILHTRVDDMVNHYIKEMRSIQPKGPYLVGGLCAGGVLAFAIACELQTQGEQVPMVAIIDAIDVNGPDQDDYHNSRRIDRLSQTFSNAGQLKGLHYVVSLLKTILTKLRNFIIYAVKTKIQNIKEQCRIRLYRYYLDKGLSLPEFLQNISVRSIYIRLAKKEYIPKIYQGQLTLWRATENLGIAGTDIDDTPAVKINSDPLLGWGKRATDGVATYDIPGGHSSMLQEPHVKVLAEQIEVFLEARQL